MTQQKPKQYLFYGVPGHKEMLQYYDANDYIEMYLMDTNNHHQLTRDDAVIILGGCLEECIQSYPPLYRCSDTEELNQRTREIISLIEQGKTVIFLLPEFQSDTTFEESILKQVCKNMLPELTFRKTKKPANISSNKNEFRNYMQNYGVSYIEFNCTNLPPNNKAVLLSDRSIISACAFHCNNVFFLPCVTPKTPIFACRAAFHAANAVEEYLRNNSKQLPEWVQTFTFEPEQDLSQQLDDLNQQVADTEAELEKFGEYKGAICFNSASLENIILKIFSEIFELPLKKQDELVEDARLCDEDGNTLAIFEIKGIGKNVKREHVNQVDTHRERLDLPDDTPGILIANTFNSAKELTDKDMAPDAQTIRKAINDNVLILRTIDLLRMANLKMQGKFDVDDFKAKLLSEHGWMYWDGEKIAINRGE